MKRLVLLSIVLTAIIACKKTDPLSPYLFGKWEVRRVYNGNIYPPDSVYKPGNGNILQFNKDSTYARYAQNTLSAQGVFHIRANAFKNGTSSYDELYYDKDTSFKYLIMINNDLMTLKPLFPDIPTTDCQKISD